LIGKGIDDPSELAKILEGRSKNWVLAVRNFLNFLIRKGYRRKSELIDFFEVSKIPRKGDVRPFEDKYVKTEDIIKGLNEIEREDRLIFCKLIIYSGAREIDAIRLLNTFDPTMLQYEDAVTGQKFKNFVRYPLYQFKKGEHKLKFYAYFPKSFLSEIKQFQLTRNMVNRREFFKYFEPQQLRKWNENFLMNQGGVHVPHIKDLAEVVDFIQGRVSRRVGAKHYRYLQEKANEVYDALADKFPF
jgi:intergrase/recombinase